MRPFERGIAFSNVACAVSAVKMVHTDFQQGQDLPNGLLHCVNGQLLAGSPKNQLLYFREDRGQIFGFENVGIVYHIHEEPPGGRDMVQLLECLPLGGFFGYPCV